MESRRVVIDTNVFISALIAQYSYPYRIFSELIGTGEYQICVSSELLEEYRGVSQREKFKKFSGFTERALDLISTVEELGIMVNPEMKIDAIKDEPDNRLLEIAIEIKAYCIVTGNTNDFIFEEFEGVKIMKPREFYELAIQKR